MLVSLPYDTLTFLPYYVGHDLGFFRDEGVELDFLYRLSGPRSGKRKAFDLCLSGDAVFFASVSGAVEARVRGWGDVRAVAGGYTRGSAIFARAGIETIADLRGKRVMTGGGASRSEITYIARTQGWQIGTDLEVLHGNEVERTEAFADPSIDAVLARSQYQVYASEHGFRHVPIAGAVWHGGGLCTSAAMIESQPDVVQHVVDAYVRATSFILAEKEEAIDIGDRNIRWADRATIAKQYDEIAFSADLTEEGLTWMLGLVGVATDIDVDLRPSDVADLTFLERAR